MESYLIRGILIGLLFGVPVGAVGAMTVQRTFHGGMGAGLVTGLGSSIADCLYACVGAFGLTLVSDFLLQYQSVINIFGGTFVVIMGIQIMIRRDSRTAAPESRTAEGVKMFLSSFAVGITNPAAILTFLFAFSYFGITGQMGWFNSIQLVAGVFIGTYIWWGSLSAAVSLIKRKTEKFSFRYMNKVFGIILISFGAAVFIKTFLY